MRHRVAGRHLGRETSHRLSLYRNLVTDLLRYERITTTEAKAKEIRPMAERIITLGRKGDLHSRRQALKFVYDPKVVKKVFDVIGPRMATRPGGYLRITGLEPRKGDGARMATIELVDVVDAPPTPRPQRVTAAPSARAAAAPVVEAPKVEEAAEAVEETAAEAAEAATAEVVAEETPAEAEPDADTATGEPAAESDEDKGAEA
ncbi:MAG: 50S ribosomal protein L17 [Chloroflexi bacterium]|nr:50S ribosomal protein L17 [Dehalococcoidia bacterium]MCO5201615.1 50S ribosomal protein L17 [Chloroflexota bacterium]